MNIIEMLTEIGFNKLESEVYIQLLSQPPVTAYKIGKLLNKPTANVYKAMDSLAQKGAIVIENNKTKYCKAISPEEFLSAYQSGLQHKVAQLKHSLKDLKEDSLDQNSYSIQSVHLVFEKAKFMLENAQKIVVIDAFPKTLQRILPLLVPLVKKGIKVHVEAYEPIDVPGATVQLHKNTGKKALSHWQSQQLNIMVDGESHLIALLNNDLTKVKQATYSQNIYMSCLLLAGALKEQTILSLLNIQDDSDFERKSKDILHKIRFFYNTDIPGFKKLTQL